MMNKYLYVLIVLCTFATTTICVESETSNMFHVISEECSFSKIFNESLLASLEKQTEFKTCQNWTAIKSVQQLSETNINHIRCLLYRESLISMCKDVQPVDKLYDLLKIESNNQSIKDVCKNLSTKEQSEFQIIRDITQNIDQCEHLCQEFRDNALVLNMMCVKSYYFNKWLVEKKKDESTGSSDKPTNEGILDDRQVPSEANLRVKAKPDNPVVDDTKPSPTNKDLNKTENKPKVSTEALAGINPTHVTEQDSKKLSEPKVNKLSSSNNSTNLSSGSTIRTNQVSPVQVALEEKPQYDTDFNIDTYHNQQAPPNNIQLDNQNTAPGQEYEEPELGNPDKVLKENTPKQGNTAIDVDPDNNIVDDDDEGVPDRFKAPKVGQLSDRYGYDADISDNSNFFGYFSFTCLVFVIGYVLYHNKQKVVALLVEGRHSRRPQRSRRPNSANYHKLDSNLEEAISSSVSKNPSHIIY